jgi:hypothetical protein
MQLQPQHTTGKLHTQPQVAELALCNSHGSWLLGLGKAANVQETSWFQPGNDRTLSVGYVQTHNPL